MDTHNTDSRLEAVIQINELLASWHRTSNHQQQLQKIRDYLATTPPTGNERTAEDVETPAEVTKYLEECFSEINSIYGAVKKVAIYGGSAFAIYEGQECYKVSFQSYNQNTVTLDAATAPSK